MTERYDAVERNVGISSYASPATDNPGFAAVVKARYSDFLVHEVDADGTVAQLTSLDNNLAEEDSKKEPVEEVKSEGMKKRDAEAADIKPSDAKKPKMEETQVTDAAEDVESLLKTVETKLSELVGPETAKGAVEMLQSWENAKKEGASPPRKGVDDEKKSFTFPLIDEKETRKAIHMLIKSDLVKQFASADTVDKKVRIWHMMFEKQMPNYGNFVKDERFKNKPKKAEWPKDRPNYLKFVLYKENIDTGTAAKDVAKIIRLPPKGRNRGGSGGLGYAGMKDKRGCTTQFCTVHRKTAQDLMILNKERNNNRRQGGGNSKFGGSAVMRVGNFSYVDKELRLGQLSGNRFDIVLRNVCIGGDSGISQDERVTLSTSVLKSAAKCLKANGFINYFGMQRFGKFLDTHLVGIAVLKGDFEQACEIIMRKKEDEHPRSVATRDKWAKRFDGVNMEDSKAVEDAEMQCARVVQRELGRFMNCETSIVSSLARKPRDYKRAFGSISKHMRSMFLHAYQSYIWNKAASHRIGDGGGSSEIRVGDLVLVENKGLADGGNGTSGLKGKEVAEVTQDDVESCKYSITDVVLPLIGSKIQYPTDSTGDVYDDLLDEADLTKDDFCQIGDRELAVGGDYRKVICKPTDVNFEIKLYKDPLQPIVKTDLMNVHNASLECVDVTGEDDNEEKPTTDPKTAEEKMIIGMVVGFTLPPSAYATIALRELTRRPTSAQYQTELSVEGDCEGNLNQPDQEPES